MLDAASFILVLLRFVSSRPLVDPLVAAHHVVPVNVLELNSWYFICDKVVNTLHNEIY